MKKLFIVILCAIICLGLFTGCNNTGNSNGDNGGDTNGETENSGALIDQNSIIQFVISDGTLEFETSYYLYTALAKIVKVLPDRVTESADTAAKEIVIGKSARPISLAAYQLLENIEYDQSAEARFLVYTDGTSIAFAYDDDPLGNFAAAKKVIYDFTDSYINNKTSFSHDTGIIFSGKINVIDYQEKLEDAELDAKFEKTKKQLLGRGIEESLADEIVAELRAYNEEVFDENLPIWIAELYDHEIGGFYYSNGARDNEGFLPDIESTQQAVSFIRQFFDVEIPKSVGDKIGQWLKGLQDPNGYFYHPQWTKEDTNNQPSRLGRDLERAIGTMALFGYYPTYDTILGHVGDGLNPDGTPLVSKTSLTGKLSNSKVSAVSKVTLASSTVEVPERLLDKEHFESYLASLPLTTSPYWVGNQLASQAAQIKARSEYLIAKEGADYSLVDILDNWLTENQNQNTGFWTQYDTLDFEGVNGLLKINAVYNVIERPMPNPIIAASSAFKVLGNGEPVETVCYVYNIWLSIRGILNNINQFSIYNAEYKQQMKELRLEILKDAPRAIRETKKAVLQFKKEDGSFSYTPKYSSEHSQGMPVTLPRQNEGDVNATTICSQSTFEFMYDVLGLSYVDPYTATDGYRILEILEG